MAREHVVRALFLPIVLGILATPASAQSLQVVGYSGYLGEWELTATVTETTSGRTKEYSGPLTMKHVGVCTQDGPEEKTGEMRFQMIGLVIPIECDIVGCRRRVHLQRTIVRRLYRHDELPRSTGGSAQAMGEIVACQDTLPGDVACASSADLPRRRRMSASVPDSGQFRAQLFIWASVALQTGQIYDRGHRGLVPMTQERRKLAAIAAFDVVGYSRLMERNESRTLAKLTSHRNERLEPSIVRHGGRLVKLIGDGALVEFTSAVEAVNAAIEFQQSMAQVNLDQNEDEQIIFRIGVHVGDVIIDGDDLYGDGVNVAARLEREASPGGVVISGNTRDAVFNRVGASFRDLGLISLKNIERPVQAFQVVFDKDERSERNGGPPGPMAQTATTGPADISSIAVRAFQNLAGKQELDFFADGLVEDIVALLARVPGFFVISKASSFAFRDPETPAATVARQLGVRYVLGGSVRAQDDQIRVLDGTRGRRDRARTLVQTFRRAANRRHQATR